ncbi:tryptophan transporter [Sporomusa sp.]|uniref:tryptophan transporter n=1 Tax=Sporomusa sp. TaxID=2078658 RepID=UPI002C5DEC4B|nr:tryptophan transporter [Sporomusa sp.]HWR42912.1 tryptophan transporter [Sporomusa sp.]
MNTKQQQEMITIKTGQEGRFRWVAVTALLLAIGVILKLVTPAIAGITPNWLIAMYCIAINLTRVSIKQAAGIGLVTGAIAIPTSKAALPYANLISEPVGAIVCALLVHASLSLTVGKINLRPAITAGISTVASGLTFITILKFALSLPMAVYLYGMLPVVMAVAAINMAITQLLYFPAKKMFGGKEE